MNLWSVEHFLNILGGFAIALLLHPAKSDDKDFNWSEVYLKKKYYL